MKMKETIVFVRMDWAEKACSKNIPNEDNHGIFTKMSHCNEATNDHKHLDLLLKHKSCPSSCTISRSFWCANYLQLHHCLSF